MGTGNESALMNSTLYLDGKPIGAGKIEQLPEITVAEDAPEPDMHLAEWSMEMTLTVKAPKRWRCRSRKRFIKLMMSEGVSRNGAVWLADFIRGLMPYGEAWRQYVLFNTWIITIRPDKGVKA